MAEFIIRDFLVEDKLIYKKRRFINYFLNRNIISIINPLAFTQS